MPYDEAFFRDQVGPTLAADYAEATRHVGDDDAWVVWPARVQADIDGGLSASASLAKHRREWRQLLGRVPPFPPAPTREQVCSLLLTFQGLTLITHQLGSKPWFEPAIQALPTVDDRLIVYNTKHALGDTHQIIEFCKGGLVYGELPHYQDVYHVTDWEAHPDQFLALTEEIIQYGFIPTIVYDGDAGDDPAHGYPNALRQMPILADLMASSQFGDLNDRVLYARFWDSVFYGSSPENIQAFGQAFRQRLPHGHLAIEFDPGHIPVGGGEADYQPGGRMVDYDTIVASFKNWPSKGGDVSQVLPRMIGQANYVPYPGQEPDKPVIPHLLATPSPRGPYVFVPMEYAEYPWTHDGITAAEVQVARQWYRDRGCQLVC